MISLGRFELVGLAAGLLMFSLGCSTNLKSDPDGIVGIDVATADVDAGHLDAGHDDHERCAGCLILGTCHRDGAMNPEDPCGFCAPEQSADSWSPNVGSVCDDGDPCTANDTCRQDFSCAGSEKNCGAYGVCEPSDGSCQCEEGYAGVLCETCSPGRILYPECQPIPSFVSIVADNFWMGSPNGNCPEGYLGDCIAEPERMDDEALHKVTLTYDFEIQTHEVTQKDYELLVGWNPSTLNCENGCEDVHPVFNTGWYDALYFANLLSEATGLTPCYLLTDIVCRDGTSVGADAAGCMDETRQGINGASMTMNDAERPQDCKGYRLPTEAEWEFACRAGDSYTALYQSDGNDGTLQHPGKEPLDPNLDQIGWYGGNNEPSGTKPVGGKNPNGWELYDMSGNVGEWTFDLYHPGYEYGDHTDPVGGKEGYERVIRGGTWYHTAQACRCAFRAKGNPFNHPVSLIGFRLARTIP